MPLDPKYLGAIKGYEGYTPRATWDYRQNSNGYGTKAKYAGEVIDKDEAERRFQYEIALARDQVRALGIPMSPGQEAALTSLTYNAGSGWINSGLGAAVKSGDWDDAAKRFVQYNKAGGETLPGLVNRRSGEASWLTDATPVGQDAEAQRGGFYGEPTPPAETSVASATSSSAPTTAKPSWSDDLASFGKSAEAALRLAKPKQQEGDGLDPIRFVAPAQLRPVKMAEAPVPYMTRADGGAIDDTGSNVPEDVNALRAQQRQLIEGRRSAQMFPRGTKELPLPPFMERIETARGVYHFDPMRVSADDIVEASRTGRENDILGLGPLSKNDVAKLMGETGESPVAITERDQAGNEVKASMATPSTVAMQSDEILRSAAPGHKVDVEPVGDVVTARDAGDRALGLARADGGEVKSRREPELNQWDPPWYERLPHRMTDLIYGENAGPKDGADMKKVFGTANPFNIPGNAQEGGNKLATGYKVGDPAMMAEGGIQAGLSVLPFAPGAARGIASQAERVMSAPTKTRSIGPWDKDFNLESDFRAARPIRPMHEINKQPPPASRQLGIDEAIARDQALIGEGPSIYRQRPVDDVADTELYYDAMKGGWYGRAAPPKPGPRERFMSEDEIQRIWDSVGKGDGQDLMRHQALARAHADLNENIPAIRDKADAYARRVGEHITETAPTFKAEDAAYKNAREVIHGERKRGSNISRYDQDAERFGVDPDLDGGLLERNELRKILEREYGADFQDKNSIENAYGRFWADEHAGRKAGTGTHHDLKAFASKRDEEEYVRRVTGLDPKDPKNKVAIDDIMDAKIGELKNQLRKQLDPDYNPTIRERIAERASEIDPMQVAKYGSAVGAGSYVGHKTSTGEWSNPVRQLLDGWRNLEDQGVDPENQRGGYYGEGKDFPADTFSRASATKRADGGMVDNYARGGGIGGGAIVGALTGATGGRADKIPGTARSGSHVLPADVVSHLGQGNSMAGLRTLQQMFKTGPYGAPLPTRRRADGGEVESEIPVMLSDGEFVVPPEMVAELGGGDIAMGHDVLDAWIMDERQKAIQTLSELPPPATD